MERRKNGPGVRYDGSMVVIRILEAKLNRSFQMFGKMDPYCIASWRYGDGRELEIARTKSAWGEHMTPKWTHSCRGVPYEGSGSGDVLQLKVLEENYGGLGKPTFCGEATAKADLLLSSTRMISNGLLSSSPDALTLKKSGEDVGTISIQVLVYAPDSPKVGPSQSFTMVDDSRFQMPVKRIGVSGGTAPFFALELLGPVGQSAGHWIGKDLSRAMDEVEFYEAHRRLSRSTSSGLGPLLNFMFEYEGVLEAQAEGGSAPLQLLVLRNLRDGCKHLRMLDIKVGEKTAAAKWKGKSRLAALRQTAVDGLTNSQAEGFRLEGFDGETPGLLSMDPLLDFGGEDAYSASTRKKAKRIALQRMPAAEMFLHFTDMHLTPTPAHTGRVLMPTELAEVVLSEICRKLVQLASACRKAPAPQKWIGSSVALGFDDQRLVEATADATEKLRESVAVRIFDWGRSELNTLEKHSCLPADQQADRLQFWRLYVGGIDRLAWEATRAYQHRFGNSDGWGTVQLAVYDFDSITENDFLGQVTIAVTAVEETTVTLTNGNRKPVLGKDGSPSTITYAVAWERLENSRFRGMWKVTIFSAKNLPVADGIRRKSDPFVQVTASSKDHLLAFQQRSAVCVENLNPVWNETFDITVAAGDTSLEVTTGTRGGHGFKTADLLPSSAIIAADGGKAEVQAVALWKQFLSHSCGSRQSNLHVSG